MAAKTDQAAARDLAAELAFLTRALKAPDPARVGGPAGRAGPGRVLDPRGVPGRLPATRGRRPRVPRRRGPHPRRPLPGPQEPGGVRLRPRPRPQARARSPTWAPWTSSPPGRTWSSSARPAPARPTWRSGWRSGPARPATGCCSPPPRQWVARLADAHHAGRLQAELVRLGRYPLLVIDEVGYIPFEPEAANLFFQLVSRPLRTRLPDRHQQQALRPLGRGLRRRRRRRGHDRPPRPPRRGHRPQGRQLPAQRPRPRPRPRGHHRRTMTNQGGQLSTVARGSVFSRR